MTATPPYVDGHALLDGKGVLVTAAAGTGIGFATAQRCQEEGARVVISDKHERRLGESAARWACPAFRATSPAKTTCNGCSPTRPSELGGIDVLVNNAGLGGTAELHEMTDEQWLVVLDVTLNGTFRCTALRSPTCTSGVVA